MSCEETTVFAVGQKVRCEGKFKNIAGTLADPPTVFFKVKAPDATVTSYTYGTDIELVKDDVGIYHVDVEATMPGTWFYRFYSTGSLQGAGETEFVVARSQF